MDPYFYEVVGKVMHFEGTFHSMFPKVKRHLRADTSVIQLFVSMMLWN